MSLIYVVFCSFVIYTVTEGRIVPGILGQNVSFSFTIRNLSDDIVLIKHNATVFSTVLTDSSFIIINQPDRVRVVFNKTASNTVTVIVNILNLKKHDVGMYSAVLPLSPTEIKDSVLLELMDEKMIPKIAIVRNHGLASNLVLECRLSNTSTGKIYWRLNGSLIVNNSRYFQNDTFLYIMNVIADDKYNLYKCEVPGSNLESDPCSIQISGPNSITFAPNITMIQEHSGLRLPCLTDCYPICSWNWTKFDPSSGGEKVISTENVLYFQNVTRQDAGRYSCRVQNKMTGVSLENFTSLEIVYGPDKLLFNLSDKTIELDERDSVTISCYADCFPPCQINWIGSHADTSMSSAELKLVNDTRDRNYTCRAMNPRKDNTAISDTIYVIVKSGTDSHHSTMETTPEGGKVIFDILKLVYIILGLGCVLVAALCIRCLRKLRKMLTYRQTIEQLSMTGTNEAV